VNFRLDLASHRPGAPWLVQRVALDLRDLVAEVVTHFRDPAPHCPVTVSLAPTPVVRGVDRTLARHALMNLIDNARKYSPPGSAISVSVDASGEILVSDRGQGIDPADLPLVFEPFFRADKSRARSTGGVGLGLPFVKLVAILHQGSVSVDSQPGVGSTFRLAFGAADRQTQSNTRRTHS
jgi:two-component system, OmpR family, sensor kinase